MPQKPRSRKKNGPKKGYVAAAAVIVVLLALVGWYFYSSTGAAPAPTPTSSASTPTNLIYATIKTTNGSFEVELFQSSAPKTVANFVALAKSGFYNNLVWHRIVDTPYPFVIQTGDPLTRNGGGDRSLWGTGGSNTSVPLEVDPSLHNDIGYLAMAHTSSSTSATSQFYINLADNVNLDGSYTVFGRVISGMGVVDTIASTPVYTSGPYLDQPINPVYVISITILASGP